MAPGSTVTIRRSVDADVPAIGSIINEAAQAYRGVIPADRWHEPYMPADELRKEISGGVVFWLAERGKERDRDKKAKVTEEEEEEQRAPPERVNGIGDEAYAVGNAKMGALYVLKGDKFLRISIGGSHSQPERIKKMKTLAQYAIKRL